MKNKTVIISGASRGIGAAMAKCLAAAGWNVVLLAKTAEVPHKVLSGTIYSVADEIRAFGGAVLPLKVDVRFEDQVARAVREAAAVFGGIDALINNASAVHIGHPTEKQVQLMNQIIVDGTRFCIEACLPYLKKSENPHVINIAPPLPMEQRWVEKYGEYAVAKRMVSEYTDIMARKHRSIIFNTLWPKKMIFTAATIALFGEEKARKHTRSAEIMADSARSILKLGSTAFSGMFFLDEKAVALENPRHIPDFSRYLLPGSAEEDLMPDVFV
jgi:citronellol/citronellal dehydrogenase